MALRKYSMMVVKAGVGLFPQSFRNYLKKSPALTSFYSHSLQKSGLFYGFPSKKKTTALYKQLLAHQEIQLAQQKSASSKKVNVLIFGFNKKISITLNSLSTNFDLINSVYCIEKESLARDIDELIFVSSISDIDTVDFPLLCINSGDQLYERTIEALANQSADIVYCDSDNTVKGVRVEPRLLPDWNPDLQFSTGYINSGVLLSSDLVKRVVVSGNFTTLYDIPSLLTSLVIKCENLTINHIPLSLVCAPQVKKRTVSALNNIAQILKDEGATTFRHEKQLVNCIQWPIKKQPLVSLIIPTKNGKELVKACIESILEKTTYKNFEIILVDNNSDEPESLAYFSELGQHPKITLLKYPHPFNYSAINNFAVSHCNGEVVGLVNNDIEVISPTWLDYMVGHVMRDDIGCVGAKLLYSDGRVQHAGVVMGYGGGAGHAHKYFPRYHPGYLNRLIASNNFSAVTAACLLVKRTHYEAVKGLNEKDLTVAFNDVDFCLKVLELGVRNLYCAEAELYHHESVSRGLDVSKEKMARFNSELAYLKAHWGHVIAHDPAYNPNLTLRHENFAIKDEKERLKEANSKTKV
jgi:GT2 family glycosyltransferase|tara:strand:+ start:1388 stop:3130 length:1743 start_codon:yes stop_codon:yes gene_type:complete